MRRGERHPSKQEYQQLGFEKTKRKNRNKNEKILCIAIYKLADL
jgi:hypothetical protein